VRLRKRLAEPLEQVRQGALAPIENGVDYDLDA
jgi:hypothetical protein